MSGLKKQNSYLPHILEGPGIPAVEFLFPSNYSLDGESATSAANFKRDGPHYLSCAVWICIFIKKQKKVYHEDCTSKLKSTDKSKSFQDAFPSYDVVCCTVRICSHRGEAFEQKHGANITCFPDCSTSIFI